ncbi:MAG: MCE family protein [Bacteroidales bacterium]|nr:MCE family protein [Bacteroidales bacterium]
MKKKISNEAKIGIIALVTILAFIYLFNYLKGKDLFSSTASYYVIYNDINGLTESNPVEISGFKAGVVQSINLIKDGSGRMLVELSIGKDFKLPKGSIAEITPASLIAGMKIRILFGNGPDYYSNRDTIPGRLAESLFTTLENEFLPVKDQISGLIDILDSVMSGINQIITPDFTNNVKSSVSNLNRSAESIAEALDSKEKNLKNVLSDLSDFSSMLSSNSQKIDTIIGNIKTLTDTLNESSIYQTFTELKLSLEETKYLLEGINKGKGTAGQLFSNDTLYRNLTSSIESLDLLLKDIQKNPKKYVHFSVFGKK